MAPPPAATSWRRRPAVLERRLPSGWLVLAPEMEAPAHLAGSAADLWDLLTIPATAAHLAEALSHRYAASPSAIRADIGQALETLVALRLVEPGPP